MEQGVGTAVKAAEGIIAADPILGGIAILLAFAFGALLLWHIKEMKRVTSEMVAQERAFRTEVLSITASVSTAIASVQQALNFITAREK